MRDTRLLRARLRLAVAVPLAAAGLTGGAVAALATAPGPQQLVRSERPGHFDVRAAGRLIDPPRPDLPRCPSGDWCGTEKSAERIANKGVPEQLDCPTILNATHKARGKHADDYKGLPRYGMINLDVTATKAARKGTAETPAVKDACCYHFTVPCPGGRPYLDGARQVVAELRCGDEWCVDLGELDVGALPPDKAAAVAAAWLDDALMEHASIGSFSRAVIELMSVAAPPELVAGAETAGLDEIRHAEICFSLHQHYAGTAKQPGALPALDPRPANLERLAVDTFIEGCLGETVASLIVGRAAERAASGRLSELLTELHGDEERHAALAWSTVAWAVAEGGSNVLAAVQKAAAAERARAMATELPPPAPFAALMASHGRLDERGQLLAKRDAWREVIDPTLRWLARQTQSPQQAALPG